MLSENIKAIRKSKGLSQEELAINGAVCFDCGNLWNLFFTYPAILPT